MHNKKLNQIIISFILVFGIFGFFIWKSDGGDKKGSYFEDEIQTKDSPSRPSSTITEKTETYKNDQYKFEIKLPINAKVTNIEEVAGQSLLIQNVGKDKEIQIYVSSLDEEMILTEERIKQDIPDIKMEKFAEVKVDQIKAITFIDLDQNTREVWFTRGGFLYQVTGDFKDDQLFGNIMESWKWR